MHAANSFYLRYAFHMSCMRAWTRNNKMLSYRWKLKKLYLLFRSFSVAFFSFLFFARHRWNYETDFLQKLVYKTKHSNADCWNHLFYNVRYIFYACLFCILACSAEIHLSKLSRGRDLESLGRENRLYLMVHCLEIMQRFDIREGKFQSKWNLRVFASTFPNVYVCTRAYKKTRILFNCLCNFENANNSREYLKKGQIRWYWFLWDSGHARVEFRLIFGNFKMPLKSIWTLYIHI